MVLILRKPQLNKRFPKNLLKNLSFDLELVLLIKRLKIN